MFTGNEPTDRNKYKRMDKDAQLQSVKEMGKPLLSPLLLSPYAITHHVVRSGLIVNYLNNQEVWDKFCATYEAIYGHFGSWDNWHRQAGYPAGPLPSMQDEWKEYIRVVLDSFVLRARDTFDFMLRGRK